MRATAQDKCYCPPTARPLSDTLTQEGPAGWAGCWAPCSPKEQTLSEAALPHGCGTVDNGPGSTGSVSGLPRPVVAAEDRGAEKTVVSLKARIKGGDNG